MFWGALAPRLAFSQTPSPLQEWQYSGGTALVKLFQPNQPDWCVELGAAAEPRPLYDGARTYRVFGGPVIDIRYRDIAFASVGEGLGVNFLHGVNYRVGVALGYDLGRREASDLDHLEGLTSIHTAPVFKLFGSYVFSKEFPLVLRADARRFVGGAQGWTADLSAYLPLPGSSETFIMFAGPSITFADRRHMQTLYGVSETQALASGYPVYTAHGGSNAVGFGFSATRFLSKRWLLNADMAVNRLLGSARASPITQSTVQGVLALSVAYKW
jgi:outer membrane scaffolding protein for murein synthesis (MipA/OmpV family)